MSLYLGNQLIAGDNSSFANQDLSNLSTVGQAVVDGKADTDLSNTTNSGKILISSLGMPSTYNTNLTMSASGTSYTMPSCGWLYISGIGTAGTASFVSANNTTNGYAMVTTIPSNYGNLCIFIPVRKNDTVIVSYANVTGWNAFRFIYAKGSESEAS